MVECRTPGREALTGVSCSWVVGVGSLSELLLVGRKSKDLAGEVE